MSGFSHSSDDMASHTDAFEMRERYARVLSAHGVALLNGLVFLVGLFFAVSPWALHFAARPSDLAVHDLIVGGAICCWRWVDALAAPLLEHETLEEADAYRIAGVPAPQSGSGR